jgi:UDP-2,3-diacylglucosamine pyrophosphatase LpxH
MLFQRIATPDIVKQYGHTLIEGGLPAKGRNNGAVEAVKQNCDLLIFIDADIVLPDPEFLEKAVAEFKKRYWPKSHMKIVKHLVNWVSKGVKVYYITGNHDELLRKFEGFELGDFSITNKLVLDIDGQKTWFFHGDVFDVVMKHSKWLAKLGGFGYEVLIRFNAFLNFFSYRLYGHKISLSKKIKNSVKSAVNFIDDFEQTAIDIAMTKKYDTVV